MAIVSVGCGDGSDDVEQPLLTSPYDAESSAESSLHTALRFNSGVHSAFALVKEDVQSGSFVFYDELQRAVPETGASIEYTVERAAEQLLEQMLMAEDDQLAANVYAFLARFADLVSQPRESVPESLLGGFLSDAIKLRSELHVKVSSQDPERKKRAYYFALAYNVVVNVSAYAHAVDGAPRSSIESGYRDAIQTNLYLVGTGKGENLGYLSGWIAQHTAGSASARTKYDKDPVVYGVRRALVEQQSALE
jgi:hypothetical protein